MASIKLGLLGAETTLPEMKYPPGGSAEIPTECQKNVSEETMLDGSSDFNVLEAHPLSFTLEFDELTWAWVVTLRGICELDQELSFINEFTDSVSYPCVVLSWGFTPIAETTGHAAILYKFHIELKGTGE
jgi:hypothetical protein